MKDGHTKKTGSTNGKSNRPGMGGRSQQLLNAGVPKAVVGMIARKKGYAPGQAGFHSGKTQNEFHAKVS